MTYQVHEVYHEYLLLYEFAEQECLFYGKNSASIFCNILSVVSGAVSEQGIWLYRKRCIDFFCYSIAFVRCFGYNLQCPLGEYKELLAFVATMANVFSVIVFYEFKNDLIQYCGNVVLAHSLKIG